jgi:hypothetical protein
VERPRWVVRFSQLMHRRVWVLGEPALRVLIGDKPGELAAARRLC